MIYENIPLNLKASDGLTPDSCGNFVIDFGKNQCDKF